MFSIKSSKFSDCFKCKWLNSKSCIIETNCEKNLLNVDVIIVAECPAENEIQQEKPLVGRSGKMFRRYFDKYLKNKCNYLITNVVLCQVVDENGKASNPDGETINNCKGNLLNIVDIVKSKLIVVMGNSPAKAFDLKINKITEERGKLFKWKNYDILLLTHPSYVNRNRGRTAEMEFQNDFIKAAKLLGLGAGIDLQIEEKKHSNKKGSYSYSIPERFYSKDYRLVDVHYMASTKKVIYIFRDKNNKKIYHETNDDYYCYQRVNKSIENRLIVKYDDLNQVHVKYKDRKRLDSKITYEGDVKIQDKHIIDYSIKNKGDFDTPELNILYMDIETDPGDYKGRPNAKEARFPIVLNTVKFGDKIITYALDNGKEIKKRNDSEIKIFKKEKDLISGFVSDLHQFNPDIITGWNVINFDMCYIFNRMPKLGLDPNTLSQFGDVYIDGDTQFANVPGYVIIDMCKLYKHLQLKKRPNNKLGTIAQIELKENKIQLEYGYSEMYREHINDYIKYNIRDVTILEKLENKPKLKFIKLLMELRKICSSSFHSCGATFGRLDCLVVKYLKENGLASKNAADQKKQKFIGAFVQEPMKGLHQYIVDFDYKSEYPNLVLTYNIGVNTFLMKFEDRLLGYDLAYGKLPDEFTMITDPLYSKKKVKFTRDKLLSTIKQYNLVYTINGCFYKAHDKELSFYSEVLEYLMNTRDVYKGMMLEAKEDKDFGNTELYDIKQKTYKILANALYGILGNENYRFFNVDLASSITSSGQEATKNTILYADEYLRQLYGYRDTTDLMKEVQIKNIIIPRNEIFSDHMNVNLEYIITGDTDSIFATFGKFIPRGFDEEKAFKKMETWCSLTQDYLNNDVVIKIIDRHNVPHERNKLKLKNELMCSRGLFISKKHYAIYVVYQEGKKVDELVMMGLETKRRDFSEYTKHCLTELISMILMPEKISFKKLNIYIKEKESEFLNMIRNGDKNIAKPVGFTKRLEEYKAHTSGARYPENIESMQNWNFLIYNEFVPGSHGYLFKVQGIDYNKAPREVVEKFNKYFLETGRKFTAICVPDEEYRLPEYIIPNVKEALNFAWINRYTQLLEPIMSSGKKMKSF